MTDEQKFPHPFDTPIVTEREVDMYEMEKDKKSDKPKLKIVKTKIRETVTYHNAPAQSFSCKKGEHDYVIIDNKKYIAKCMKCTKHWKMNPQYHQLQGGHILQRDHKYIID